MATHVIRIVAMPAKLGQRNDEVQENPHGYRNLDYDYDNVPNRGAFTPTPAATPPTPEA
jgi:hypothetical protein